MLENSRKYDARPSPEGSGDYLDQISAVIQEPGARGRTLYVGWSQTGVPMIATSYAQLGEVARESTKLMEPVEYSFRRREWSGMSLVPAEYLATSEAIDRPDRGSHFTEDILTYGAMDANGKTHTVYITELELLNAIADDVIVWQGVNQDTYRKEEGYLPTTPMYSIVLETTIDDHETLVLLQFKPALKGESNEAVFQRFLTSTMDSLIRMDAKQLLRKKGYDSVLANYLNSNKDVVGRDAFVLFYMLRSLGVLNVSDEKLRQLKIESADKGFWEQVKIVLREAKIIEFTGEVDAKKQHMQKFDTSELIDLFRKTRSKMLRLFEG